jgi:alanine racemase
MHNAFIEINTYIFQNNLKLIRDQINVVSPNSKFCLPLKANAYGHGLTEIATIATPYVDYFAVACLNEGKKLRQNNINLPILVFGTFSEEQIYELIYFDLEITVSSLFKAQLITTFCEQNNQVAKIHIKVDIGMNRVGVRLESAIKLIEYVLSRPELQLMGIYSHLPNAEDLCNKNETYTQIQEFTMLINYVKSINNNIICHLANSAGFCYFKEAYFDMVRPGIISYGYLPAQTNNANMIPVKLKKITPCFSVKSRVVFFKVVKKDQWISYGQSYKTTNMTRIITIPIGYGDGYRRTLSNQGEVLIRGHKYSIAGVVCMDMCMVDIGMDEAYINDEVVLIGKQGNLEITLNSVAAKCQTINYEILCGFNERLPRIYNDQANSS